MLRPKNKNGRQPRNRQVMSFEQPSPPTSSGQGPKCSTLTGNYETSVVSPTSSVVAAVELDKFELRDTTLLDFTSYCRVYLNDTHKTTGSQQVKNIANFLTRDRKFSQWRNWQAGAKAKRPRTRGTLLIKSETSCHMEILKSNPVD